MARKKNNIADDIVNMDFSNLSFDFDPDKADEEAEDVEKEDAHFRKERFDDFEDYELSDRYIKPVKCFFKTTAIKYENAKKLAADLQRPRIFGMMFWFPARSYSAILSTPL